MSWLWKRGHMARNPSPAHLVDIGRVTEFVTEPPPERAGHWRRGRSGSQRAVHRRNVSRSRGGALTLTERGGDFPSAAIDCNLSGVYHYCYATQRPTFTLWLFVTQISLVGTVPPLKSRL